MREKKLIYFLPKVKNSINVDALSFFSSLLFTHSPRLRTNVFLIFSSSVASQACGRGEAGMTDKSGIVSPDEPSRAVTWRRWATAKNPFIKTTYDYAKWFSILGRKTSSTYYGLCCFWLSAIKDIDHVFVVCVVSQKRRGSGVFFGFFFRFWFVCLFVFAFFCCLLVCLLVSKCC